MNLKPSLLILLVFAGSLTAQGPASWEPAVPFVGDSILISFDPVKSSAIPDAATSLVLHWGVNETSAGAWSPPPQDLWPAGTVLHSDGKAARSPMSKNGSLWQLKIPTDARLETVHFVINTGTPAVPGTSWDNNNGNNWNITLRMETIQAVILIPEPDNSYGDLRRSPAFVPESGQLEFIGTAVINEIPLDSLILMMLYVRCAPTRCSMS